MCHGVRSDRAEPTTPLGVGVPKTVQTERSGPNKAVATVRLDRPEAMNALDVPTKIALRDTLLELADDPRVRAVVLTGTGRAFCAGQDLREHVALLESDNPVPMATVTEHYNPIVLALTTMPKPVVAAVNGAAAGAGAALAFACDLRIAARSASFVTAFTRIGLSVDSGTSWTLPRLVGPARAAELMMLSEAVDAERALAMGLVAEVVDDDALATRAAELAERLAAGPTQAYASIKATLQFSASHDLASALANEGDHVARTGQTEDHRDAVRAFLAKRPATFHGR